MENQESNSDYRRFLINVDDYTVVRHIYTSTYGAVFLVQNTQTGKQIVAKIIKPREDDDEEKYKWSIEKLDL